MTTTSEGSPRKSLLLIGASRGLGLAIAEQYLERGWLHDLRERWNGLLEIETVDITVPDQVIALRRRRQDRPLDFLFVNAGVKNDDRETIADVSTEEFVRVMVTNALSPLRVVEAFHDLVHPNGTIAIMSSGQGSVTNNERGGYEV